MENPALIGVISWFVPGVGHIVEGRYIRGAIIAVAVWSMFIIALASGGTHFPGFEFKDGALLYLLNTFARLGNGLGAIISWLVDASPSQNVAALATFEYGGRFLEVAGLLNYLSTMDAVDIALGRKK